MQHSSEMYNTLLLGNYKNILEISVLGEYICIKKREKIFFWRVC